MRQQKRLPTTETMYDQQNYLQSHSHNEQQETTLNIGMTATTFKERYANHTSSFRHKEDSNKTELSKHI
jgi:hypothetical protein